MNDKDTAEKTAIAAHLYITVRRKLNRVIDVEWLAQNEDYAREIIAIARKPGLEEASVYVTRLEELVYGKAEVKAAEPEPVFEERKFFADEVEEEQDNADRYIGTLR
jgi:hypothetical protein